MMKTGSERGSPLALRYWLGSFLAALLIAPSASARTLPMPTLGDLVGSTQTLHTRYTDTFADIGQAHSLGYLALVNANPKVDPWLPGKGTKIELPTRYILPSGPHKGIVINLAEFRLYYYHDQQVQIFPIGIGTDANPSPVAATRVITRIKAPAWYPPASIRREHAAEGDYLPGVVPPGPDNPLGPYALKLGVPGYFIHGTDKQFGIGTRVSHGCFRMYNPDITRLFKEVKPGTPVRIVNQPVKLGMQGTRLFIEVHRGNDGQNGKGAPKLGSLEKQTQKLLQGWLLQYPGLHIDQQALQTALRANSGMPTRIGRLEMDTMVAGTSSQTAVDNSKH